MHMAKSMCVGVGGCAPPHQLVLELILAENLVEHDFDVVGGVPIAVVVEGACFLEDSMQFDAPGAHEFDIGLSRGVAVFEGAFFLCFAPEDLVIAIGIKRRVDINKVNTFRREFFSTVRGYRRNK